MNKNPLNRINVTNGPVAIGVLDLASGDVAWRTPDTERRSMTRAMVLLRQEGWPAGVQVLDLDNGELSPSIGAQLTSESPVSIATLIPLC